MAFIPTERKVTTNSITLSQHTALRNLIEYVFEMDEVRGVLEKEISTAVSVGEWEVIAHDATYKAALEIPGQTKNGPLDSSPTDYRAVRTFRGISGATPGFSCQNDESAEGFKKAIYDVPR